MKQKKIILTLLFICVSINIMAQIQGISVSNISVTSEKTTHIIFPSDLKYVNFNPELIVAQYPDEAPRVLRLKSSTEEPFSEMTNISAVTEDGKFYSWNVTYEKELEDTYIYSDNTRTKVDTIFINDKAITHLVSPERIVYVDYGSSSIHSSKATNTENIINLTAENVNFPQTNISIYTEKNNFYTYNVSYKEHPDFFTYNIGETTVDNVVLSTTQVQGEFLKEILEQIKQKNRSIRHIGVKKYKLELFIRNIYVHKDIIAFELGLKNNSNFDYQINFMKYSINDTKNHKKAAMQTLDITPIFVDGLSEKGEVKGKSTQIFIALFNKFTLEDNKKFEIQFMERNGGRNIKIDIKSDMIINAKAL